MRIALVTREYPPETPWGGISSFYVQLARGLLEHGHDVEVFSQGIYHEHTQRVDGILVHRVMARTNVVGPAAGGSQAENADLSNFAFSLAQEFLRVFLLRHHEQPFELVEGHEHLGVNAFINQYAPDNVVTVTRYHTSYHSLVKRGLVDWPVLPRISSLERLSLTAADFRVATSTFIDAIIREDFGLTDPAPVLANFTAPPASPPPTPEDGPRENLVIFAGRLVQEHKRPDLAARAFRALAEEFPHWRMEFAGPDMPQPEGRTTWQLCEGHLTDLDPTRWHYHGALPFDEMEKLYRRAKVIVVPSRFESFGMVAIEAMHHGCVPLVSDQTALIDATASPELEFRNGDLGDMVDKLRILMGDEASWRQGSDYCRARAVQVFNRDHLLLQNIDLFARLLERHAVRTFPAATPKPASALPLISIVTPSYNHAEWIEETIKSVLYQDYPRIEHIVMDGGSTDHTVQILRKYRHLQWSSEKDLGQSHAINKGLLMARGEIVAYLNSDDVYRPGAFQAVARAFQENPDVQIVVGNCDLIDAGAKVTGHLKARAGSFKDLIQYWRWDELHCIPQQSVFLRRSLLSEIGMFETRFHMVMDYNFWLRVARVHHFHVIDQTLAAFRIIPSSKTSSRTDEMYHEEYIASSEFWHELTAAERRDIAFKARRHVASKLLDLAEHYLLSTTQGRRPLKHLWTSFTWWPPIVLRPRYLLSLYGSIVKGPNASSRRAAEFHRRYLHRAWLKMQRP